MPKLRLVATLTRLEPANPSSHPFLEQVQDASDHKVRLILMVPRAGIEPALRKRNRILSPACLPIPPPGHSRNQGDFSR